MCYRFITTQWKVVVKMFPCLSHDLLFPFLWIMLFFPWSFHLLCKKKKNGIKTTVKQRDKIWTFGPWTRVKCQPLFLESHPVPGSRHTVDPDYDPSITYSLSAYTQAWRHPSSASMRDIFTFTTLPDLHGWRYSYTEKRAFFRLSPVFISPIFFWLKKSLLKAKVTKRLK